MLFRANVYVSCHSPLLVILLPLSEFSGLMKILKILFNWHQLVGGNWQQTEMVNTLLLLLGEMHEGGEIVQYNISFTGEVSGGVCVGSGYQASHGDPIGIVFCTNLVNPWWIRWLIACEHNVTNHPYCDSRRWQALCCLTCPLLLHGGGMEGQKHSLCH